MAVKIVTGPVQVFVIGFDKPDFNGPPDPRLGHGTSPGQPFGVLPDSRCVLSA